MAGRNPYLVTYIDPDGTEYTETMMADRGDEVARRIAMRGGRITSIDWDYDYAHREKSAKISFIGIALVVLGVLGFVVLYWYRTR